jgi:hypothetical protein
MLGCPEAALADAENALENAREIGQGLIATNHLEPSKAQTISQLRFRRERTEQVALAEIQKVVLRSRGARKERSCLHGEQRNGQTPQPSLSNARIINTDFSEQRIADASRPRTLTRDQPPMPTDLTRGAHS